MVAILIEKESTALKVLQLSLSYKSLVIVTPLLEEREENRYISQAESRVRDMSHLLSSGVI